VGHYPLFLRKVDEPEEYWNLPPAKRKELLNLFARHNVVAMVGGHKHSAFINDHQGIQLVNGESTSKNFDKHPVGFRLWHVGATRPYRHDYIPLDDFPGRDLPPAPKPT
jgi:serine/threonine-protein phosphatase CPPED1